VTPVGVSSDIATDVVASIQLPWKNPIEPGFFPQHPLQVFPPILKQPWPRKATVLVNPPARLAELVRAEEFHARVNLPFDPANHPRKEMTDKF
jgi:hypothetical protein